MIMILIAAHGSGHAHIYAVICRRRGSAAADNGTDTHSTCMHMIIIIDIKLHAYVHGLSMHMRMHAMMHI